MPSSLGATLLAKNLLRILVLGPNLLELHSRNSPALRGALEVEFIGAAKSVVLVWLGRVHSSGEPEITSAAGLVAIDSEVHVGHGVLQSLESVLGVASDGCDFVSSHNITPFLEPEHAVGDEAIGELVPFVIIGCVAVAIQ